MRCFRSSPDLSEDVHRVLGKRRKRRMRRRGLSRVRGRGYQEAQEERAEGSDTRPFHTTTVTPNRPDHSRLRFVKRVEEDCNAQVCQQMD
jgi:hypothetical protein